MIPRYQRIAYWCLLGGIALMAALLIHGCVRDRERVIEMRDQSPIPAPVDSPDETVSVAHANDLDGSISTEPITLALPQEPSVRARVLLDRTLADAALPASTHPVPPGPAVTDVFFLPLPLTPHLAPGADAPAYDPNSLPEHSPYGTNHLTGATLAIVNLSKAFADAHPSSIAAEDLTLRVLISTLHSNFPEVDTVRFLVDGQSRDTLAGHADLTRPYPVGDTATKSIHPLAADGSPE